jgi:hypothetical protein
VFGHVEPDFSVRLDVRPEERNQAAFIFGGEDARPFWLGEDVGLLGPLAPLAMTLDASKRRDGGSRSRSRNRAEDLLRLGL